jgi:cytochrome c oxidase subunit 3
MGVRSAQTSQKKSLLVYCGLTVLGAAIFMVVKFIEYKAKFDHGFLPVFGGTEYIEATGQLAWFKDIHNEMAGVANPSLFFAIYFTMTGIHGVHVLIGAGLIIWIMFGAAKGRFHANYFLPVDLVGLYWHLVDLIWIFLFPLLYLVP